MKFSTKISDLISLVKKRYNYKEFRISQPIPVTQNREFILFKKIGENLSIPEIVNLEEKQFTDKIKKDILLKYSDFHKKFMMEFCPTFKYYHTIDELEKKGFKLDSHLTQLESVKVKLDEKTQILLNSPDGKKYLGIFVPDISIDINFDEIIIISNPIYNYFYGRGKDLNFLTTNISLSLDEILQTMETNGINDIGIDPINDSQFNISAEIAKKNILLNKRPLLKQVILDIYNQAMIEMQKDHTTEAPTMTGSLKKDLINKHGVHITREFRFNFIKIKNGLTLSIRRFMNCDEIEELGLKGLNYMDEAIELIDLGLKEKTNSVVVIGETNSGKSTVSTVMLYQLYKWNLKIITIDNPTEITMPFFRQIDLTDTENADEKFRMTKEKALGGALRHNPNVLSVSEIRGKEEIQYFVNVALRGHMSFTTLHAGSVSDAIQILLKSANKTELRNILNLFIHQELIACKCLDCKGTGIFKYKEKEKEKEKTCPKCEGVGSVGILPIYEIAKFNNLSVEDDIEDLNALLRNGKLKYLSKRVAVKYFYEKGLVHEEDYSRIINKQIIGD